jgi:hypothetical protein
MNAIELLKQQHDEVDELIERIEDADDRERKRELFAELGDRLAAHATIEEKIFYPAVFARQTEDLLRESTEEHLAIKRVLADMLDMDVDDEQFDAKLAVVKEEVTHHAREEEEGELFPKVEKLFDDGDLDGIGDEMEVMFETLMEEQPRFEIPSETDEAAKL